MSSKYYRRASFMASSGGARYPLIGRVYVKNGAWHDANGPCHLLFHSDFQLVNLVATNLPEARAGLQALAAVGSGLRIFTRLGADYEVVGKHPYYSDPFFGPNREIDTLMCRDYLEQALDECAAVGLKVITTMGSASRTDEIEMAFHDMVADIIVRSGHHCLSGGRATVILAEHRNEPNQTSQYGWEDRHKAWDLAERTMKAFKAKVGCLISGGSWGDNDQMFPASQGMDVIDYHEDRSMPECIHHIHTAWNDAVFHRNYAKPLYGGERPGPNAPYPENTNMYPHRSKGGDMYVGNDNPETLWGVLGQAHFTGQATSLLTGPGVRRAVGLDSTTGGLCGDIVDLVHTYIAKDAGLWRGPNPSWRTPAAFADADKRFMWAGLREWFEQTAPPFPVAHWQAIGPTGVTDEGDATIQIAGPWKFRLIIGTRA